MKRLPFFKTRLFLGLLLVVALLGFLGWAVSQSRGYVLISYDRFRYESSFWVFLGLLASLWLLSVLLHWTLGLLGASGSWVNPWSRRHRQRRVANASQKGLRELAEGQWQQALGHLRLAAEHDPQPLVHFLGAARAANELGEYPQSDELLGKALDREPQAALAIGLTQAQLQIARGDYVPARESLTALHGEYPRHRHVLLLLQQLYVQLQDWPALCQLLPELGKLHVLPPARLAELERLAWTAALGQAAQAGLEALQQRWQALPRALRDEPALVRAHADGLLLLGEQEKAEELLASALKRQYDDRLVESYGRVRGRDPARQLGLAESWLKAQPENPTLLLALGRLSLRNELWGKARDYLEASLRLEHRPDTCADLARLLAQLGDSERSNRLFHEGLELIEAGK
ncbi:heme biosynthesis HemY N-terminal domain-containing protein [Stutzerimonas kirkiae]|uniref:heme biosynthesis HemY N-terminal domain-containing protein n=1 Tax=Stutzerimonas kirkiae TaxID=2211392 RepID=UPI0010384BC4|nr:heme biosynthesis HemY N-terminal domain-containing protein [Stutzerimonas kirkiae]TBV03860.1 heme biosynthesis protein HemY [Stutzerimonas kirkiae]TBV14884.1 heme biosynthesis protein HemY [Stutzerimonas kirkiae]